MTIPSRLEETGEAPAGGHSPLAAGHWPGSAAPAVGRGLGRELGGGLRELRAKLVTYYLVRLRPHRQALHGERDLAALVAEVYRRGPKQTAFLLERLCYDFVRARWRGREEPRHLLLGEAPGSLPEQSLILLHAGLGMALTERLLSPLRAGSPGGAFDAALDRFAELVAANARPEYAPVVYEALGLMVRRFLARLHGAVEARLRARDARLAAYYWHGAGRAIYFLPGSFHPFPGAARRGLEVCRRDPREASHRLDAASGYCFASTMINLRHPELVARLLPHLEPGEAAALASGIAGALLTRHHTCPDDPAVRGFLRPIAKPGAGPAADRLAALWEDAVRGPCAAALDHAYPLLRARGELACLARHRPLGTLLAPQRED
jgi:hypothetical protein